MGAPGTDAQRAAFDDEVRRIRAMTDPVAAFRAASDLVERHVEFRGLAALVRAEQAQRVYATGEMTLTDLAGRLGVTKQRADQLLKRARETPAGLELFAETAVAGLAPMQDDVRTLEATARRMLHFQASHVPGLLQTPDYARAVLALALPDPAADLDEAVGVRIGRQEILVDPERQFEFVLTEAAVRWLPDTASPDLIAGQVGHIAAVSRLPNVTVGVIPAGTPMHTLPISPFIIYDERDGGLEPFVIVELAHAAVYASTAPEVEIYRTRLAALRRDALFGAEGRTALGTMLREREA